MMEAKLRRSGAMTESILATFQKAYRDFALVPLIKPEV